MPIADVDPLSVLAAHLAEVSDLREPEFFVQRDTRVIGESDYSDECVQTALAKIAD